MSPNFAVYCNCKFTIFISYNKAFYSLIPKITPFCGIILQKSRHFMELYSKKHAVCRLLIMDNMVYSVLVFFLFDFRCELNVGTRHAVSVSVEKFSVCLFFLNYVGTHGSCVPCEVKVISNSRMLIKKTRKIHYLSR